MGFSVRVYLKIGVGSQKGLGVCLWFPFKTRLSRLSSAGLGTWLSTHAAALASEREAEALREDLKPPAERKKRKRKRRGYICPSIMTSMHTRTLIG